LRASNRNEQEARRESHRLRPSEQINKHLRPRRTDLGGSASPAEADTYFLLCIALFRSITPYDGVSEKMSLPPSIVGITGLKVSTGSFFALKAPVREGVRESFSLV
jgi:hypothetical protein